MEFDSLLRQPWSMSCEENFQKILQKLVLLSFCCISVLLNFFLSFVKSEIYTLCSCNFFRRKIRLILAYGFLRLNFLLVRCTILTKERVVKWFRCRAQMPIVSRSNPTSSILCKLSVKWKIKSIDTCI